MADTTYINQKVYLKQDAEKLVIANGGYAKVESGGSIDLESGGGLDIESGATIGVESGGEVNTESGGRIDLESGAELRLQAGANFDFYNGENFSAEQMLGIARNAASSVTISNSNATNLSTMGGSNPPVLPSNYGTIWLSCGSTLTNGSARMFSARRGQMVWIAFTETESSSLASIQIYFSKTGLAGVKCLASTGSVLSQIHIYQSIASQGRVCFIGIEDGVWAILTSKSVVENSE